MRKPFVNIFCACILLAYFVQDGMLPSANEFECTIPKRLITIVSSLHSRKLYAPALCVAVCV